MNTDVTRMLLRIIAADALPQVLVRIFLQLSNTSGAIERCRESFHTNAATSLMVIDVHVYSALLRTEYFPRWQQNGRKSEDKCH